MSHSCKNLIIHCIDFRFIGEIQNFMKDSNLTGDCDVVAMAGSVKNLVSPGSETDRETFLKQIELSKKLHGVTDIYLVNHMDCGAYGGHSAFENESIEQRKHTDELMAAAHDIAERYPEMRIHPFLAHIKDHEISFESISEVSTHHLT